MNHHTQATEFHFTIGITVRGVGESEPVQAYVVDAVHELAHSRLFLSGRIGAGVVSKHDNDHGRVVTTTTVTRERRPASGSSLPPHQQRVLDEKMERDQEITRLDTFIRENAVFPTLPADEQARLRRQLDVMHELSTILGERIANF
ncbi:hypothetical protein A4F85_04545 [Delftia sp. GW456-R20]|uniref:crAss001_48 related protein n=1 Tax=Delftia sp. GW456-R20 TaxID=1827145 RepID=UPI0007AEAEC6|nr:hypothetical protein [Delftia sp. GW456-R20]KZK31990.1 hypothetical protein A4F85_04545 [Delftia sp. GW456-R20]